MFHTPAHKNLAAPGHSFVPTPAPECDFRYLNHGSIIILRAVTARAKEWAEENLPDAASSAFGYSIEPRYFSDVVDGIDNAGLYFAPEGR